MDFDGWKCILNNGLSFHKKKSNDRETNWKIYLSTRRVNLKFKNYLQPDRPKKANQWLYVYFRFSLYISFIPSKVPRSLVHVFFPINAYNLLFLFFQIFRAFGSIDIIVEPKMITLEWIASPCNDMFADAVLSAVLQVKTFLMVIKIFVSILRMLLRILIFENYICSFFL